MGETFYRFAIGVFSEEKFLGFVTESENPFADRYMISDSMYFHESCVWNTSLMAVDRLKGEIREMFADYILKTVEVFIIYKVLEGKK